MGRPTGARHGACDGTACGGAGAQGAGALGHAEERHWAQPQVGDWHAGAWSKERSCVHEQVLIPTLE